MTRGTAADAIFRDRKRVAGKPLFPQKGLRHIFAEEREQHMSVQRRTALAPSEAEVITKAVLRAADSLGLPNKVLANVLGLSEATISRMCNGAYLLQRGQKPFGLAALLVRLYRSLDRKSTRLNSSH